MTRVSDYVAQQCGVSAAITAVCGIVALAVMAALVLRAVWIFIRAWLS